MLNADWLITGPLVETNKIMKGTKACIMAYFDDVENSPSEFNKRPNKRFTNCATFQGKDNL